MNNILIVGQTPPPYHGQAIMIERMLEGVYPDIKLYHVRMRFSDQIDDIGRFRIGKIYHLLQLILRTYHLSLNRNIKILYYPPAGPKLVPVLRDIVFLIAVRWLFSVRIFDFHAAGLSGFYSQSKGVLKCLMKLAYFAPDAAIGASGQAAQDGRALGAKRAFVIPNGIEDHAGSLTSRSRPGTGHADPPVILYVGVLREDKGIMVMLEALRLLRNRGVPAFLQLVGHFGSAEFERIVREFIICHNIQEDVRLAGVLTGDDKWQAFRDADIFCFPSHFFAESFPVCLVEALSFGLPAVTTRWRGIPDIVGDGENGFLVSTGDAPAVAERLEQLIIDPGLRKAMGRVGRAKFEREYTLAQYHARLNAAFESIIAS